MLRAARAMREAEAILLLADDPVALTDVPALANANGWVINLREHANYVEYHLHKSVEPSGR